MARDFISKIVLRITLIIPILFSVNIARSQDKNFYTTIGLGMGPSFVVGQFQNKNISNIKAGYALNPGFSFEFLINQNIGKRIGLSANFHSATYQFDIPSFEKSLALDNRGLAPDQGLKYNIISTESEWIVSVANLGMYFYKNIGEKKNTQLKFIASMTVTDMNSPMFDVEIKDTNNTTIQVQNVESAETWREVFFLPPVDGFSLEINAHYFFSKHLSFTSTVYYANSIGRFESSEKALINMSKVKYDAFNLSLGISYTFFHDRNR